MEVIPHSKEMGGPLPVFVCGMAHGGTTLLLRLLDSHPLVAVLPSETQLYPVVANRHVLRWITRGADLLDWFSLPAALGVGSISSMTWQGPEAFAGRLRIWAREFPHVPDDPDAIIAKIVDGARGPLAYWSVVMQIFERISGIDLTTKRYWIEKTPSNERFAPANERLFGRCCRHIHVLRDPRDLIASTLLMRTDTADARRELEIARLCFMWSRSVQWCRRNLRAYGGRYLAVSYEGIVRQPSDVMRAICRFLEIPMNDSVLTPTRLGTPIPPNSSYSDLDNAPGIVQSQVGRFAEVLTTHEVELVERLLSAQMGACGYVPSVTSADQTFAMRHLPTTVRRHPKSLLKALKVAYTQATYQDTRLSLAKAPLEKEPQRP